MPVSKPGRPFNSPFSPPKRSTDTATPDSGSFAHKSVEKKQGQAIASDLATSPHHPKPTSAPVTQREARLPELNQTLRSKLWEIAPSLPDDPEFCRQLIIDSALAEFTYEQRKDLISEPSEIVLEETSARQGIGRNFELLEEAEPLQFQALILALKALPVFKGSVLQVKDGLIYDKKSGLVFTLFTDKESGQSKLAFGGTFSGRKLPQDTKRLAMNQVAADFKNISGIGIPKMYQQADALVEITKSLFPANTLTLTGHSLGGGLAQYAGCMHEVPANCFASAALGKPALQELQRQGKLNPEWIKNNIFHVLVENDPINNPPKTARFRVQFAPTNLGKRILLESSEYLRKGKVSGYHCCTHDHVREYTTRVIKRREVESGF
ncbi:hypothetical protein EOPP23_10830 [Endozoicomonas sp. OPT23]|uniref:hypothetical protein n=1 Tax=Endozoicomonas sp. OPT23 TaxID=2072845 RepID=UPI00129B5A67|nr:hypothetical protein [Endozoicomonas sp. OPT23]MRI33479.1 hypothetical protein [Endozoicomonas sp. OPT23]